MNLGDIKNEILVRGAITTSTGYYTDEMIADWIDSSYRLATGYKKWPFTEGRVSTTYSAIEEFSYPEGWKADSIRFMTIGDKRLDKKTFIDYKIYREEESSGDDRIYSDFGLLYFVNPNADVSGTTVLYGQYIPAPLDHTNPSDNTVFTNREERGNEAIINEALSYLFTRDKKFNEATLHHQKAIEILNEMEKDINNEQFAYQTKDRGMFERFDVLNGSVSDEILNRDQF